MAVTDSRVLGGRFTGATTLHLDDALDPRGRLVVVGNGMAGARFVEEVLERGGGEQKYGAYYDAACCYALDGRADAAIGALEAAFDAGYWDAPHLLGDEDLKSLRAHAKWSAIETRAQV